MVRPGDQTVKKTKLFFTGLRKKGASFWGRWFLVGGLLLLMTSSLILFFKAPPLSFETNPQVSILPNIFFPQQVIIDSVGINLPVYQAQVEADNWPLFEDGASYLVGSGQIGQAGNVVIYAHNKKHLFGPIKEIKVGELIKIEDENDQVWTYQVEKILVVSPQEIGVLSSKNYPALTLYTCTGFLDQKRLTVIARLLDEESKQ